MIKYTVEIMDETLIEELKPILLKHWEEIAMYRDKIEFKPNYQSYITMQESDLLQAVIVRKDGGIIGYYISFIYIHPHYSNDKMAQNDILFVHPDHRGGTVAYRMFKFAEKSLKEIGCSVNTIHMKTKFPFERLCQKLGMDKQEIIYSKYIGD